MMSLISSWTKTYWMLTQIIELQNEKAVDSDGVSREVYFAFWEHFLEQCEGEDERVPRLRPHYCEKEWHSWTTTSYQADCHQLLLLPVVKESFQWMKNSWWCHLPDFFQWQSEHRLKKHYRATWMKVMKRNGFTLPALYRQLTGCHFNNGIQSSSSRHVHIHVLCNYYSESPCHWLTKVIALWCTYNVEWLPMVIFVGALCGIHAANNCQEQNIVQQKYWIFILPCFSLLWLCHLLPVHAKEGKKFNYFEIYDTPI